MSLPLTNAAGILQVSPASPYIGLTSSFDASQDEPERFYLTGKRTFGRIAPGDTVQAAAQVALLRRLGVQQAVLGRRTRTRSTRRWRRSSRATPNTPGSKWWATTRSRSLPARTSPAR